MTLTRNIAAASLLAVLPLATGCSTTEAQQAAAFNQEEAVYTAVSNLLNDYGFEADKRDTAAVTALFSENGTLSVPAAGMSVSGRAAIEAGYSQTWSALSGQPVQRRHIISGLRLTNQSEAGADFRAIMNVTEKRQGAPAKLHLTGYYTGRAIQTDAGWQFQQLTINID